MPLPAPAAPVQPGLLAAGGALDSADTRRGDDAARRRGGQPGLFRLQGLRGRPGSRRRASTSSAFPAASNTARRARSASARASGCAGSFRYIGERDLRRHAEIEGLGNIQWSAEAGLGVGYEQRNWRVFTDVRYGFIGHNAWVGEVGADAIAYPIDGPDADRRAAPELLRRQLRQHLLRRVQRGIAANGNLDAFRRQRRSARRRGDLRGALPLQRALGRRGRRQPGTGC